MDAGQVYLLSYQYLCSHTVHSMSSIECHDSTPIGGHLAVWWVLLVETSTLGRNWSPVTSKKFQRVLI